MSLGSLILWNSLYMTTLYSPFLGVAFLLVDAKECVSTEEIFLTKIETFINIHQNGFLVLFAPLHGPEEWNLMFRIHQRYGPEHSPGFCLYCLHCFICSSVQKAHVMEIADSHLLLRWADSVPCPALFFDFHLVDLALS